MVKMKRRVRKRIELQGGVKPCDFDEKERFLALVSDDEYPFIWIGNANLCFGWIDSIRSVRALRRMCDDYLEARGVE